MSFAFGIYCPFPRSSGWVDPSVRIFSSGRHHPNAIWSLGVRVQRTEVYHGYWFVILKIVGPKFEPILRQQQKKVTSRMTGDVVDNAVILRSNSVVNNACDWFDLHRDIPLSSSYVECLVFHPSFWICFYCWPWKLSSDISSPEHINILIQLTEIYRLTLIWRTNYHPQDFRRESSWRLGKCFE
jgi:hypothetical protein